jgi:hypothetical protein
VVLLDLDWGLRWVTRAGGNGVVFDCPEVYALICGYYVHGFHNIVK